MNKILAILFASAGGLFIYSRAAIASLPKLDVQSLFIGNNDDTQKNQRPVVDAQFIKDGDNLTLARTIWGEARDQGYKGMQAVANVIMNRYMAAQVSNLAANQFGCTISEICQKPYQFSAWNKNDPNRAKLLVVDDTNKDFAQALSIASRALRGDLPDATGGADHYLNIPLTESLRGGDLPSWVDLRFKTADIGAHTFLKLA